MNIVIPDDYQDAVRTLDAFHKLSSHNVTICNDVERTIYNCCTLTRNPHDGGKACPHTRTIVL